MEPRPYQKLTAMYFSSPSWLWYPLLVSVSSTGYGLQEAYDFTYHFLPAVGAGIKYGSLLLDAPFEANPLLALIIVGAPPISFAAYLLLGQRRE